MVAIRILDELQEPGVQGLDDEPYLLLCPEALDQLLHCPRPETHTTHTLNKSVRTRSSSRNRRIKLTVLPVDVEGDPDERQGVGGESEHELHPLPGVAGGEQLLHEVVPEGVHHELRGVARHADEDEVHLAFAVVQPLLQEPAPVLVPGDVVHEPAKAGQALAVRLRGTRRRRRAGAALPPPVLAPRTRRGRWCRRWRQAPTVGSVEGEAIEQRRHVRGVVRQGERLRRGHKIVAFFGQVEAGKAESAGGDRNLRLVVAVGDAHLGQFMDEVVEVLCLGVDDATADEAAVVEEGDLVEQHLHLPVQLHLPQLR
jgi:hypothetical protein